MKNKYKGLAKYLVEKDQYLALNIEQARYIVKLVKKFEKSKEQNLFTIVEFTGKRPKPKKFSKKEQEQYDKITKMVEEGFDKALKDMLK